MGNSTQRQSLFHSIFKFVKLVLSLTSELLRSAVPWSDSQMTIELDRLLHGLVVAVPATACW